MHKSVLLKEVLEYLNLGPNKVIVDCTIGSGGHAEAILKEIMPGGRLIGIDCDRESLEIARGRLEKYKKEFTLVHSNFRDLEKILAELGQGKVDGILFDLGVSSLHFDRAERGFSFRSDGPLDMRLDRSQKVTAQDLVNNLPEEGLARILKDYGEERFGRRIARNIVFVRKRQPIDSTFKLASAVLAAVPARYKYGKIHPATRTFQALRIAVNNELNALKSALGQAISSLSETGRLCVIAYHSLEDRIVKFEFKEKAKSGILKIITKKPITPSASEIEENPRARSAKLRAAEKAL